MITLFLSLNFGVWKAPEGSIIFPEAGKAPADVLAFADEMIAKSLKEDVAIVTYSELVLLRVQRRLVEGKKFSVKVVLVEDCQTREVAIDDTWTDGKLFGEDFDEVMAIDMTKAKILKSKKG